MNNKVISYRKLVMNEDLNAAGSLFGGKMMAMIDEAGALYTMCQLKTKNIVTISVDKLLFKVPVSLGDFLIFKAETIKVGTTSITIKIEVFKKDLENNIDTLVTECQMVFVSIDEKTKKPIAHKLSQGGSK